MNKLLFLITLITALSAGGVNTAEARERRHDSRYDRHDDRRDDYDRRQEHYRESRYRPRTRTIYVIERNRPIRRVVYIDSSGRYYRVINGRRSYVRSRYYTSYPSRYYYPDGRRRIGVSIAF